MKAKYRYGLGCAFLMGHLAFFVVSCGNGPTPPASTVSGIEPADSSAVCEPLVEPAVFNVFVENSGSMDGYVKGVTEFEQAVYSYLSDVKLSDMCSEMNLNYINSQVFRWPDDVRNFIERLEPSSFRQRGGNRGTTDIANIIEAVIGEQRSNEVNILVSDFVFSPGRNRDAHEYLVNQQIGIKSSVAEKLKAQPDMSIVVFQLNSNFRGRYFNCQDVPTVIDSERPFYMMVSGSRQNLQRLMREVPETQIKGSGVRHAWRISNSTVSPNFMVQNMPRIGSFMIDLSKKVGIKRIRPDKRNPVTRFSFSVGVDFSSLFLGDEYLCDPANYTVSDKAYALAVTRGRTGGDAYSHLLTLSLAQDIISKGDVTVTLNKARPAWADEMTDEDGVDINADEAMGKTFGLRYLLDGIYEAYSAKGDSYASLTINIQ